LDKPESHLLNSTQKTLHGPSAKLSRVIGNFFSQTDSCKVFEFLAPVLTLFAPFRKHEAVQVLIRYFEVAVNLAPNANVEILAKVPYFVNVANSDRHLVFILNIGI
jgi:hypothetical protein